MEVHLLTLLGCDKEGENRPGESSLVCFAVLDRESLFIPSDEVHSV